ncbi:MAG TPA: hypothetical protein VEI97_10880, partial [bacterium]|nr:hypothetical protein [bacterium]
PDAVVTAPRAGEAEALIRRTGLQFPLIVKGSTAGSTIGLTKVHDPGGLTEAVETALAVSPVALVEECAVGVEISVPLLGNGAPRVLPTPEIVSDNELFDYQAKYTPGMSHHVYPPRSEADKVALAEQQASALYELLGCAGCGRADFIIPAVGPPVFLELNTLPGMTAMSILPDAAAQVGIGFEELCETLVRLGLAEALTRSAAMLLEAAPRG